MSKHTPEPWTVEVSPHQNEFSHFIESPNSPAKTIACLEKRTTRNSPPTEEESANARLIAAAPELLATLEAVWDFWAGGDAPKELEDRIKAAIAKAEGGAA